ASRLMALWLRWRSSARAAVRWRRHGTADPAYLGMSVPGFPNFFLLYGPNTGGGTGSVIYTIEAGMNHVISALDALESSHAQRIEVRQEVADSFDAELRGALADTVWHTGCTSWYVDQNHQVGSRPVETSRCATSPILLWVSRAARRSLLKAVMEST
ncbi:MAG TPA: hypothetical protein VNC63_06435, partial [Propionibacteriaceae bacterium]|nr:hypothetical protein [Propionibacteriaceae bacterium]